MVIAINDYRSEMDIIGNLVKDCYVQKPGIMIKLMELYGAYQKWCTENNEHTVSERFWR